MHDVPFPPRGGGRVDMWGRLRALVGLGHEVDVLIAVWELPGQEVIREIRKYAAEVMFSYRSPMWKGLFRSQPCQINSRGSVASIRLSRAYDLVLLDGDSVGAVLENPSLQAKQLVVRTHNWEANYFQERSMTAGASWLMRCYDRIEAHRYPKYSNRLFDRCDAVWWVSIDELEDACKARPELRAKSKWLPHFHDVSRMRPYASALNCTVLFVGALNPPQNSEAVLWYLDRIHPKLVGLPGYRFIAAGGTDNRRLPPGIERMTSDPHCLLMKDVPDLAPVYASARVFVNPVLRGAGINSKTIHAISDGLPVVTTTPGYRGTGLKPGLHLLAEDDPDKMAAALRAILEGQVDAEAMVRSAQQFLIDHYDHRKCLEALIGDLNQERAGGADAMIDHARQR
jgi:polysaccharide biosynthesis protein PslH